MPSACCSGVHLLCDKIRYNYFLRCVPSCAVSLGSLFCAFIFKCATNKRWKVSRICGVHSFKKLLPVLNCPSWAAPSGWEGISWPYSLAPIPGLGQPIDPCVTRLCSCFNHISVNGVMVDFPPQSAHLTAEVMLTVLKNVILLSSQLSSEDSAKMWNCSGEAQEWHGCRKYSGCDWVGNRSNKTDWSCSFSCRTIL